MRLWSTNHTQMNTCARQQHRNDRYMHAMTSEAMPDGCHCHTFETQLNHGKYCHRGSTALQPLRALIRTRIVSDYAMKNAYMTEPRRMTNTL